MGHWQERALCAGADPTIYFQQRGHKAKKVCPHCPVRLDCLEWALEHDERFGIWGGSTEGERELLAKRISNGSTARELAEHYLRVGHARWA